MIGTLVGAFLWGRLPSLAANLEITVESVALFLTAIRAYWVAAAVALLFFAFRRRAGLLYVLVNAVLVWLLLRGLGALLRFLIPCIAPDAESAFGFVVAVSLSYVLPLRLWQRVLPLAIVVLMASTRAIALGCQVPGELALAAGVIFFGALLLWLLSQWRVTLGLWQPLALAIDNWSTRQARTPLTPSLQAVLAARLRQHLDFIVEDLEPVGAFGVHASTPIILTGHTAGGEPRRYFAKIVSRRNWQLSVSYQVVRWLQYRGRLRSGPLWPSLKALVEYEHYMMLLFRDLGVPAPRPWGIYRLERQAYALVSDYLEGVRTLREVDQVSEAYVSQALRALRRLRDADCAHRDIKASNLIVLPGDRFAFVDLALAEYVAGSQRLARDLADMLVVLSMHHDPVAVVAAAHDIIGARGLHRATTYLHRGLLNGETQKMLPQRLLAELREVVTRETSSVKRDRHT